jgi:hypothetical protein
MVGFKGPAGKRWRKRESGVHGSGIATVTGGVALLSWYA